jgi:hypothetical protein
LSGLRNDPRPDVFNAGELYESLRSAKEFAGSEMNIEGAVYMDKKIRLFNRGNGASSEGGDSVNASCDLDWQSLYSYLMNPKEKPPALENVVRYNLGFFSDLPLGFTDATDCGEQLFFSAAAEDSPDAVTDGKVLGSILGIFDGQNNIRWAEVKYKDGQRFSSKIEGVAFLENERDRVFVVVDQDSPNEPSELCEILLTGPWFSN